MADFIDIHTHIALGGGRQVLNRRLGVEPLENDGRPRSVGIHPWDAEVLYPTLSTLLAELEVADCVTIGEIGLDKCCKVDFALQTEVFEAQLRIAERRRLPVVVHCVRAQQEAVKILKKYNLVQVVFHGFIGSPGQAAELVKSGWFISFGFNMLHSPKTIEALCATPLSNLFLESDTDERPIEELYDAVTQIKALELELIKSEIENNYYKIFG